MIRTLRAFFLARLLREKILLVALALIVVVLWTSNWAGRCIGFANDKARAATALKQQNRWLSSKERVENAARQAASRFDPAKTLDSTRLLAAVSAIANEAGLKNSTSGESQDVSNGQFSVHALQFTVTKIDWGTLNAFYAALQARSPYIGVEQFTIVADRGNPSLLSASMKISSVEIGQAH